MKRILALISVCAMAGTLSTCSDKSTTPSNRDVTSKLYQVPGCLGPVLAIYQIPDSCFSYKFGDTLVVEFCLAGNCCPDSNRYILTHDIRNDTIHVAVSDTAENLCYCICDYRVHAEFVNVPLNRYVFVCTRTDDSGKVYYNEIVSRNLSLIRK